jgi:hypothetical protein
LYVDFRKRHPHLLTNSKRVEFKEALLNDPYFNAFKLKFGYAITCHKAQGSEWSQVFLKCSSHHKTLTKDYFRWLYTAITRTSAQLFVIDEPHIKLGSGMKRVASADFSMPNFEFDNPNEIRTPSLSNDQTPEYTSEQPMIVTETTKVKDMPSEQSFGIQPNNTPMLFLLAEIKSALIGLGIDVVDITHNQWQESYLFQRQV